MRIWSRNQFTAVIETPVIIHWERILIDEICLPLADVFLELFPTAASPVAERETLSHCLRQTSLMADFGSAHHRSNQKFDLAKQQHESWNLSIDTQCNEQVNLYKL